LQMLIRHRYAPKVQHLVQRISAEGQRGAAALFAGIGAGIEPALPMPAFKRTGIADAAGDGADVDIAEIGMRAVLAFGVTAAGELGHSALKRSGTGHGKPLHFWAE